MTCLIVRSSPLITPIPCRTSQTRASSRWVAPTTTRPAWAASGPTPRRVVAEWALHLNVQEVATPLALHTRAVDAVRIQTRWLEVFQNKIPAPLSDDKEHQTRVNRTLKWSSWGQTTTRLTTLTLLQTLCMITTLCRVDRDLVKMTHTVAISRDKLLEAATCRNSKLKQLVIKAVVPRQEKQSLYPRRSPIMLRSLRIVNKILHLQKAKSSCFYPRTRSVESQFMRKKSLFVDHRKFLKRMNEGCQLQVTRVFKLEILDSNY